MLKIYTAQYRYPGKHCLDITVKGKDPVGRVFAPTWPMVNKWKKDQNEWEYIQAYHNLMIASYDSDTTVWEDLLARQAVVLVCFCPAGSFCHRNLLAQYLIQLGGQFYGELLEANDWLPKEIKTYFYCHPESECIWFSTKPDEAGGDGGMVEEISEDDFNRLDAQGWTLSGD